MRMRSGSLAALLAVSAAAAGCAQMQALTNRNLADRATPAATGTAAASPTASATNGGLFGTVKNDLSAGLARTRENLTEKTSAPARAIDAITPDEERAIGQAAALNIIQQSGGLILEESLVKYLNAAANAIAQEGERLVKGADGIPRVKARRFFVGVLDDDSMNAYGLPGGYILLTRGLLQNLTCESDLAFVLGHEIAHIDAEHGLKALKATVGTRAAFKQFTGTGDGQGASFSDSTFFATVVDAITNISFEAGLGKQDELDADNLGLQYATRAGYDSKSAKRVLDLLALYPAKQKFFGTHPTPQARITTLGKSLESRTSGTLGVERFDSGCLQRLEASKSARASTK